MRLDKVRLEGFAVGGQVQQLHLWQPHRTDLRRRRALASPAIRWTSRSSSIKQADAQLLGRGGQGQGRPLHDRRAAAHCPPIFSPTTCAPSSTSGDNVPRIPPYRVGGGLSWESDCFDAGLMLSYTGPQTKLAVAETQTKGFVSLDGQITVRPFKSYQGLEFSVAGRNLTDRVQRNAVSINKDEVIMPGRDVRFVVRETF